MAAYVIVEFTPKDQEKLQEYGASVPPTLAKHAGKVLVKGSAERLHGNSNYKMSVIIAFPSKEDAMQWYHSPEYQALIPTRDTGMDSQFQVVG